MNQGCRIIEKYLDFVYSLKTELTGFADELNVVCEKEKGVKNDSRASS